MCIQTAAALQTWTLHYKLTIHAKAEELNKICIHRQILVHREILCLSAIKTCKDFPFIVNSFHLSLMAAQHETGGVALNSAILHVQLYIRMCPTLFWCYAVESLVMNSEQVQIGCSTSCCSQSLLPHMLFWNGFCYFCFCLVLLYILCLFPCPSCTDPSTQILQSWVYWWWLKDVFSYFIQTFLCAYECNSERQSSNTHL